MSLKLRQGEGPTGTGLNSKKGSGEVQSPTWSRARLFTTITD